uniref:Uncharacterized protein ycf20 n=1 Tax=Platysiphonia delicata TaxID=2006979 RepID=A0A1Z1M0Y2_9FLOR|nr:hypothetical protein [Platysiphonia delicata]ARW59550.1 hypothetical protein [Platysiphonia delicata]
MIIKQLLLKVYSKVQKDEFHTFSIKIMSFMFGFFISSILSTLPAQTEDWNIISSATIITLHEVISLFIYRSGKNQTISLLNLLNNVKIGIMYGLFVDAFKLGS